MLGGHRADLRPVTCADLASLVPVMEPIAAPGVILAAPGLEIMQAAVDRVMQAYSLMVSLSEAGQLEVRRRVAAHLADLAGDDRILAIEGLRFLRSAAHPMERRTPAADDLIADEPNIAQPRTYPRFR
jgi:hypothetical protein